MFSSIIDSHCHLDFPKFSKDRDEAISRAREAGVEAMINSGIDFKTNLSSLRLAEQYDFIYATAGLSPSVASTKDDERIGEVLKQLSELGEKVIGIGEAGLDYYHYKELGQRQKQKETFEKVIEIADGFGKPLIIHGRDAEDECFEMSKNLETVVFHCYGGSLETMEKIADAGHYISIPTLVCFSEHHQEIAKSVPQELMIIETDSPYLSPRKGRNEPAYLADSLEVIAKLRGITAEEVATITTKNTRKAFKI
ncbi:TatD DNase family protein [Methanohalophilus levihalophilus]|uniref:TatD family hydrolase n=1 Tax=Methanohalophilus levihalophilus TaxID=1431282 RepID=UPI001AE73504|nr:TatD family hydrolase [Methanohalophilus levihalophilus]MBP2029822.1 TatD DNase family protein [Methanohalophilus levihalophilus]